MRGRLITTRLVQMSILVYLLVTFFAMHANTVTAHYDQKARVPISESLASDDSDAIRLEHVTPSLPSSVQPPIPVAPRVLAGLHLSPIILQPPETA